MIIFNRYFLIYLIFFLSCIYVSNLDLKDLVAYKNSFEIAFAYLNTISFLSEPLFSLYNAAMSFFIEDFETYKYFHIFWTFSITFIGCHVLGRFSYFESLVLFSNPALLQNYFIHLRQGMAISIFFLIMLLFKKRIFASNRNALFYASISSFFAGLVHLSFFLIFTIFITLFLLSYLRNKETAFSVFIPLILLLFISFNIFFAETIRNSEVFQISFFPNGIGFGFVFALLVLIFSSSKDRQGISINWIFASGIISYISFYMITPYAGRLFDSLFIILSAIFKDRIPFPFASLLLMSAFFLMNWIYIIYFTRIWFN